MSVRKLLRDYLDALVHPSARPDAMAVLRHRAFMAPRLLGSLVTLVAFPAYLALRGAPSVTELLAFCWLLAPILVSYYLSRTGRYESAQILSALALAGLVTLVAAKTGGIRSFATAWLVVVPLEAALSRSRRVAATGLIFALCAAGLLLGFDLGHLLPAQDSSLGALAVLGIISASLYAAGLAFGAPSAARADNAASEREQDHYRQLASSMTDALIHYARSGAALFVSPSAETLFGASAAALRGSGLFERVHIADRPAYMRALAAAAQGEAQALEFRVRHTGESPLPVRFIWVDMRCSPLSALGSDRAEAAVGVVAVLRDVTERKAVERGLEESRVEAERANAAKDRLLAVVSHELRTPLNAIIGFSDLLAGDSELALACERRADYAKLINASGHHLLALVNDILVVSTLASGELELRPEPVALTALAFSCCDLLALQARDAGIALAIEVDAALPPIMADKRALKQILINLLSNAIKFTDRGGRVAVAAQREGADVVITVEDNGIGIGESDVPHLGDPFFKSCDARHRRGEGTGLGLSIVKALVCRHGGELAIASRVGAGTRVAVRLPFEGNGTAPPKSVPPLKPTATITRLAISAETAAEAAIPVKKRA